MVEDWCNGSCISNYICICIFYSLKSIVIYNKIFYFFINFVRLISVVDFVVEVRNRY